MDGSRIFVSYRRQDSPGFAGRIADHLDRHFGEQAVFRDVEAIEYGTDFVIAIDRAVASCVLLIVVIGPQWSTVLDREGRRRLDNPDDFVRLEVATALKRGIRVIPVLVQGAPLPKIEDLPVDLHPIARRQAIEVSDERFTGDMERLIRSIESGLKKAGATHLLARGAPRQRSLAADTSERRAPTWKKPALLGGCLVLASAIAVFSLQLGLHQDELAAVNHTQPIPLVAPERSPIPNEPMANAPGEPSPAPAVVLPTTLSPQARDERVGSRRARRMRIAIEEADSEFPSPEPAARDVPLGKTGDVDSPPRDDDASSTTPTSSDTAGSADSSKTPFHPVGLWEGSWIDRPKRQSGRMTLQVSQDGRVTGWFSNDVAHKSYRIRGNLSKELELDLACQCGAAVGFDLRGTLRTNQNDEVRGAMELSSNGVVLGLNQVILKRRALPPD